MERDRIEGKAKQIEGELTGDESREAEGRIQEKLGKSKEAPGRMWENLKDKAGRIVNERADRKQRDEAKR